MTAQYLESTEVSQTRAILPRLYYSQESLHNLLSEIYSEESSLVHYNQKYIVGLEHYSKSDLEMIKKESLVRLAVIVLEQTQKKLGDITHMSTILQIIPMLVPTIREISAKLHDCYPQYGTHLCEISSILGGILMDSASMTSAKFDFEQSNSSSCVIIDKAKLIVDSKLSKLYPNLDFNRDFDT